MHRASFALASMAVLSLLLGCGTSWPKVRGIGDPNFVQHRLPVRTIDVLPVDVAVTVHPKSRVDAEAVARGLDPMVDSALFDQLLARGYAVAAAIEWDGSYASGSRQAMSEDELAVTAVALSSYGTAQASTKGTSLLVPHLPVRLGVHTRSDATLYVRGWAHQGIIQRTSTGSKVAKGLLIGAVAVGIIALAVAGAKSGGGSVGKIGSGVAKVAAKAGEGALQAAGGIGRATRLLVQATARGVVRTGVIVGRYGPRIALESLDAFGRSGFHTHVHIQAPPQHPPPARHRKPMRKSSMFLEMTLIDNRSGIALWHARRVLPAEPRRASHVHRAIERMLATLPTAN